MATKNKGVIGSWWMFMLVTTLDTIIQSRVEGLKTLDKNNFGPKPKGTIKTIEIPEDGDTIDCVDIYKQPAFDNLRIKDLKVAPSLSCLSLFNKSIASQENLIQNWNKYGECPEGTIPIRRTRNNNDNVHRKAPNDKPSNIHEYAIASESGSIYHGANAIFNVWNPQVSGPNEFSLSQMWISSGKHHPPVNTIEAGWIVYPFLFGDSRTRIFIFWTGDAYNKTGCYNLICAGFVQTDRRIVLGGTLGPISVYGKSAYDFPINIIRDKETSDWWLHVNHIRVGYFPRKLFTSLDKGADRAVRFGGEIINHESGNRHTTTQMGSGHIPQEGFRKASYIRNIEVVNDKYKTVDASLESLVTRPECYNVLFGRPETNWKSRFYFGGLGYSPHCS